VDAVTRFLSFYEALPAERRLALARAYAEDADRRGAYVMKPDGSRVPIPPILTPKVVGSELMRRVSSDAHLLVTGLQRLTAVLMSDPARAPLRQRLFGTFTPVEAEGLASTWRSAEQLATARVDYLVDQSGVPRALEVNATIPAMQGYSDCIAEAFFRAVARERGLADADALVAENGRNTDELLASLLAHHTRLGGASDRPLSIAIVHRAGDAQIGELTHYMKRWSELGHAVWLATPADCQRGGDRAIVSGRPADLIYRHIFARRLSLDDEFAQMCLHPERWHVWNPIASHLEVKGMLGLLSAAASDPASPLDEDERDAARRALPWTRVLAAEPTSGPDGAALADLAAFTRSEGAHLVLKRSWDYGGKSVFLGAELDDDATQARLRQITGLAGHVGWSDLTGFALSDGDAWVVQALVPAHTERHLRVGPEGPEARDLYVDLSAYAATGTGAHPTGGAVRAAGSRIVNILGGGGVAPLVREAVLEKLLDL
jgi:hypothetical protein